MKDSWQDWLPFLVASSMIILWLLFWGSVWGAVLYVSIHFLRKVW